MKTKDFCALLTNALSKQAKIAHILESDHSILVACDDESNFFVNIIESKRTFIHDQKDSAYIEEYIVKLLSHFI